MRAFSCFQSLNGRFEWLSVPQDSATETSILTRWSHEITRAFCSDLAELDEDDSDDDEYFEALDTDEEGLIDEVVKATSKPESNRTPDSVSDTEPPRFQRFRSCGANEVKQSDWSETIGFFRRRSSVSSVSTHESLDLDYQDCVPDLGYGHSGSSLGYRDFHHGPSRRNSLGYAPSQSQRNSSGSFGCQSLALESTRSKRHSGELCRRSIGHVGSSHSGRCTSGSRRSSLGHGHCFGDGNSRGRSLGYGKNPHSQRCSGDHSLGYGSRRSSMSNGASRRNSTGYVSRRSSSGNSRRNSLAQSSISSEVSCGSTCEVDLGYGDYGPDLGYGDAIPSSQLNCSPEEEIGYQSDGPLSRKHRSTARRRCSVTKYSLEAQQAAQQQIAEEERRQLRLRQQRMLSECSLLECEEDSDYDTDYDTDYDSDY